MYWTLHRDRLLLVISTALAPFRQHNVTRQYRCPIKRPGAFYAADNGQAGLHAPRTIRRSMQGRAARRSRVQAVGEGGCLRVGRRTARPGEVGRLRLSDGVSNGRMWVYGNPRVWRGRAREPVDVMGALPESPTPATWRRRCQHTRILAMASRQGRFIIQGFECAHGGDIVDGGSETRPPCCASSSLHRKTHGPNPRHIPLASRPPDVSSTINTRGLRLWIIEVYANSAAAWPHESPVIAILTRIRRRFEETKGILG